jgi:tol-pal system protein YbgF
MPSNPPIMNEAQVGAQVGAPVGAPGGREVGAPLDLSTLSANPPADQQAAAPQASAIPAPQTGQLPPVMSQPNAPPAGQRLATLPPSSSPKDEYDLAYGYVLRKDYALAAQAFHDFMGKHPNDKMMPNAQFWLGESQYQQQRYREAAESFLAVSTKYEKSGKAPESLLRLGQSLGALHQKEAACATLAEVGRKYPKASPQVKNDVAQEQKRGHC